MKRLKLRKEVKVITTLLSFGLLCTVVPTINAVAEDAGTEDNTVETNTVDATVTDDNVVEEPVVEEVESPETDLYTRLMNTTTVEEFNAIANAATDEEINLLSDEQNSEITSHINELSGTDEFNIQEDIISDLEIVYVYDNSTVNFTNAAPLVKSTNADE